jgi:hypothetical protein
MSIVISPEQGIIIQNSFNQEKFNSNDKLLYKQYTFSRSNISLGSSSQPTNRVSTDIGLTTRLDLNKTISIITITFISSTGNVASTLLNTSIQLNVPILTHREYVSSPTVIGASRWEVFSGCILNSSTSTSSSSVLRFSIHSNTLQYFLKNIVFNCKLSSFRYSY